MIRELLVMAWESFLHGDWLGHWRAWVEVWHVTV